MRSRPQFVGLKTYFRGVRFDGQVELHTIQQGYCGLGEVTGDIGNLCCWVKARDFQRAGGSAAEFLASARRQNPLLSLRLRQAEQVGTQWCTTSIADRRSATPVEEGIWNIGDRAAMVAPLTGDGMGMGLRTAELAVTIALKAFQGELPWDTAAMEYAHCWRQEFLPRLRWGRIIEGILLQPRLASVACLTLHWLPALTDLVYHRTRQVNPGRDSFLNVSS